MYIHDWIINEKLLFNALPLLQHLIFEGNVGDIQWCFSQVKGAIETEDVTEGNEHWGFISGELVNE